MLSNNCSILLIDDDADVLDAYTQLLEQAGYHVSACNNPFDAREQVPKDWPGIVLSDVCMPGCSGIDLMTLFHQDDDLLPILLITGHGDVPMAVEAVKKGAWDFLQKPIDPGKLLTLVDAALRQRQSVIARRQYCQQKLQVELIGRSQWTVRYRQRLQQLAETDIAVWLNRLHRVRLSDATTVAPFGSVVTYQFTGPAPDGARVDSEGNVYVAISGQGRVMVFNRNGLPIGQIVLPDRDKGRNLKSTSLAIRPGHRELFIVANSGTEPGGAMIFRSGAFAPAPFPFSHQ